VLADSYPNAAFTISDAGSKMEAASASNDTLTLLLISMAIIVFIVGGIGIMNVLFVSVKERTNEIGILKALGCARKDILLEFLLEASCISLIGSVIGVMLSLGITPVLESFDIRVSLSVGGGVLSLLFGVLTGSAFGFYPAFKASSLIPVVALNQE
jgi:putative ABC transport system permease protein